jgi:hypothetical protein
MGIPSQAAFLYIKVSPRHDEKNPPSRALPETDEDDTLSSRCIYAALGAYCGPNGVLRAE